MPALGSVGAPGLLGGGSGGVCGVRVLAEVSGSCVLNLRGVHYVLSIVGQLDVSLGKKNTVIELFEHLHIKGGY